MSGRGVGAGSGRSGKTFEQLEREVAELKKLVKELIQPKSRARVVNVGTPGAKFYVFTATSNFSSGECTATIDELDGTEVETGATVSDPTGHMAGLLTGVNGLCIRQGSEYYAITPYVTSVDWDGTDLTFNRSTTETNIDTPEDC